MANGTPDLTLLTALPFESKLACLLRLRPVGGAAADAIPVFSGSISGCTVMVIETGIRSARLEPMGAHPALAPRLGVLSVGMAGGLDPALPGGAVVTAREVVFAGEQLQADPRLHALLAAARARPIDRILTAGDIIVDPEGKAAVRPETGAQAVDLESGVIGRWASAHGIPFGVLRGISDPAGRALPRLVLERRTGLGSLLVHPRLLPLAWHSVQARRRICRVVASACEQISGE